MWNTNFAPDVCLFWETHVFICENGRCLENIMIRPYVQTFAFKRHIWHCSWCFLCKRVLKSKTLFAMIYQQLVSRVKRNWQKYWDQKSVLWLWLDLLSADKWSEIEWINNCAPLFVQTLSIFLFLHDSLMWNANVFQ